MSVSTNTIGAMHYPIPPTHEINKILQFSVFLDLDMTSLISSVQVVRIGLQQCCLFKQFGVQVEPMFMPEGIKPASSILQKNVAEMFRDFQDWMIVIFVIIR